MTTITAPRTVTSSPATPASRLRTVLLVNAATSSAAGVLGLVATDRIVDELGIQSSGWTRLVAVGFLVFAVDVALAARSHRHLATTALVTSVLDLSWVAATVVALATIDLTGAGQVLAVVVGLLVLDFAGLQLWFRSRLVG